MDKLKDRLIDGKQSVTHHPEVGLPEGWKWVILGDICELKYGKGLPTNKRKAGKYPIFGSNGVIGYHESAYTNGETIIIGRKGSIGETHYSQLKCWPIDTTYFIEAQPEVVYVRWLFFLFKTLDLKKHNKGAAIPGINREDIYKMKVVFPKIDDQKHIINNLDGKLAKVENAKRAAEMQFEDLLKLRLRVLSDSLMNGRRVNLKDCLYEVTEGIGSDWAKYPVYGATRQGLAPAKEKVGKKPERYKLLNPGTLFYNPMRINIGSIAMLGENDPPGITSPDYVVIRTKEKIIHPVWFYYWLRSNYGENLIKSLARGAVRERMLYKRLSKGIIEIPEYREQEIAAKKFLEIENLISKIKEQINLIDLLPQTYLRRAFSGEFL